MLNNLIGKCFESLVDLTNEVISLGFSDPYNITTEEYMLEEGSFATFLEYQEFIVFFEPIEFEGFKIIDVVEQKL